MEDKIKYNEKQLNVAEHFMTTGHEYNPESNKKEDVPNKDKKVNESEIINEGNAKKTLEILQRIVKDSQYEKIQGQNVDGTTANLLLKVYDAIKQPDMKNKFMSMPIKNMVSLAWSLTN